LLAAAFLAMASVLTLSAGASIYTITPGGPAVTITTTSAGENATISFSGTAGRSISLSLRSVTIAQAYVTVQKPDGTNLVTSTLVTTSGKFIDTKLLPVSGTYTILVDPVNTYTGSMTLTLYDVPANLTGTIVAGGAPVTVATTTPGQNASLTFSGTSGGRISLRIASVTMSSVKVSILNPDNTTLVAAVTVTNTGTYIDTKTLTQTGTHKIVIDPAAANTGSMTLTLYDGSAGSSGTISPGGAPVTVAVNAPGATGQVTFAGTAGQRVSLTITQSTMSGYKVSILNPDSTVLASVSPTTTADAFIDTKTLPATGTYTIVVDPTGTTTGSVTLTLYAVPGDAAGTITPGGAAVSVAMTVPGQNASLTFAGTAGNRVSLRLTNVTIGSAVFSGSNVSILKPDGTSLVTPTGINTGGGFIDTRTLPVTGTYTILVDPATTNTGGMTLTLYDVPPDVTTTIVPNGAAVTMTMTTPGQNGLATFTGTAGDTITLTVSSVTNGSAKVSVMKPDGTTLISPSGAAQLSAGLPVTGIYTILADPQAQFTGSVTLGLAASSTPPSPPALTITESSPDTATGAGPTLYYRPGGAGGSFTVLATPVGTTAIQKMRFPGLSGGITPTALTDKTMSPFSMLYTWTTGATYNSTSNQVTAFDFAGRTASSSFGVVPDSAAPVTSDNSAGIGSAWHNTVPQTVTLTPTDAVSGVAVTRWTDDGTTPTATSATGTTVSMPVEGVYTIKYFSVDKVGNTEPVKTAATQIRIDTTPPSSATLGALPAVVKNGQVLTGSAADALSGIASVSYYWCAGTGCSPSTLIGTGSGGTYAYTWNAEPADGTYTIVARAFDAAGNTLDSAAQTVAIDNTPPDTSITSGPANPTNQTGASFSFTATQTSTFECQIDGGAWTACSSPVAYSSLSAGSHTFQVRATDVNGNVDPTPASATWTIDLTPPDTSITSTPANPTNQTGAAFSFTSTETGSSFQCQLDAGGWLSCTSPKSYAGLSSATHTFQVRAIDAAGNVDATPASFSWTVDTVPPDTTITSGPTGVIGQSSATFAFTSSKAGSSFRCQLDAGALVSCTSPVTYNALAEGSHSISVVATDSLGNVDPTPAVRTWTVDTTPPDTTITAHPGNPSSQNSPSFSFTSTEPGSTFECQLDAGAWLSCTSPKSYAGLSESGHTFAVRATDGAGNTDPSAATYTWTIDLTAPASPSIDSGPSGRVAATTASFSFSDADPTATAFRCSLDGAAAVSCSSPTAYSGLSSASHTLAVSAVDAAGNASAPTTANWTVDATGPAVTLTTPASGASTSNTTPSYGGAAGTAFGDLDPITVTVHSGPTTGGAVVETLTATASLGTWSTVSGGLTDGQYTVQATQSDDLGNVGASAARTFTVDTAPPPAPSFTTKPAATSATTSPSFGFTDTESGVTFSCSLDASAFSACTSPTSLTVTANAAHTFVVKATDAAGNISSTTSYSWAVDTTAPSIGSTPASTSATAAPSFGFTSAVYAAFQCRLDAGSFAACTSPTSYAGLAAGSHTFSVRALDANGAATPAQSFTWTIVTAAPSITANPPATSAQTAPSFSFTHASYASFECKLDAGAFAACTSPRAYAGLTAGSHTFTVHALDANGVATLNASYTWTINTAAPTLSLTTKTTGGTTTATATFSHPVYTSFECQIDGGAFAACTTGKTFPVASGSGLHTVNVRAIDGAGVRTATATATFTA
jgi:hypothetical protein